MKVKEFNKVTCREVSKEIETALKKVATKYGIDIKTGNGRFSSDTFDLKIKCARIVGGKTLTKEVRDFKLYARSVGLKATDLHRVFCSGSKTFKITGYNTKAHKFPIMGIDIKTGRGYKFPADHVRLLLDK